MNILDQIAPDAAVIVALGSNMAGEYGSPDEVLEQAMKALGETGVKILARSRLWRSRAWPDPAAPEYRNAVCLVETRLAPASLLATLHWIEREFGRTRNLPNAPRTLDLDLIAYGRIIATAPDLPHPRAAERRFVMGPMAELAPGWVHPVLGETAAALAAAATVGQDATPVA